MPKNWFIDLNQLSLGGFAPAFWESSYPTFGRRNQVADMTNIDVTNPAYITQGAGLSVLTDGDENGAVTELINAILDHAVASDVTYGVGGSLFHKLSSTAVVNTGNFPHTINHPGKTAEAGEDVAYYQGNVYYSYNHSANGGDVGQYNVSGDSFDDDYMSTTPTNGASLQGTYPHPMLAAGNDVLYILNKNYVSSFDGATFTEIDLDLPNDFVGQDLKWADNRIFIAANRIDLTGNNRNWGSLFRWTGQAIDTSWEIESRSRRRYGGMFEKNGTIFVFNQDITSTGGYYLSYIVGNKLVDLTQYTGSLPSYSQITEHKGFVIWVSSNEIWGWGTNALDLPVRLAQIADAGFNDTTGALAAPFGTPMVASYDGATNYQLAKFANYDTNAAFKSLTFDVSGEGRTSNIEFLKVWSEPMASGERVDIQLKDNGGNSLYPTALEYSQSALGSVSSHKFVQTLKGIDNLRAELDFSNGSTTAPSRIKRILIKGNYVE